MYDFQLKGGPIDNPAGCEEAFACYGRAAAAWARMEHHLDMVIIHVNKRAHSEELHGEHPVSFDRKIDTLKRWFNKHDALKPYAQDMREITSRARTMSKQYRNFMLHCFFRAYDAATRTITLHKISVLPSGDIRISRREQTLEQMGAFTELCIMLNDYVLHVSQQIFSQDVLLQLRTLSRPSPGRSRPPRHARKRRRP